MSFSLSSLLPRIFHRRHLRKGHDRKLYLEQLEVRELLSVVPVLNSIPEASKSLYLEFKGYFEDNWGHNLNLPDQAPYAHAEVKPFSAGADTSQFITDVWRQVADDFSPFDINVTTMNPGTIGDNKALRVAVGPEKDNWLPGLSTGIADGRIDPQGNVIVGGFYRPELSNTVWVFSDLLYDPDNRGDSRSVGVLRIANTISHEAGHAFGLQHQSDFDANGNPLNDGYSVGNADWTPIMGDNFNELDRHTWYNGHPVNSSTAIQDDVAIISGTSNGFGYRDDDRGNTASSSFPFYRSGNSLEAKGAIENWDDVDVFAFKSSGGPIDIKVVTGSRDKDYINASTDATAIAVPGANLDVRLELRSETGTVLADTGQLPSLGARITATASPGNHTYYLYVKSAHQYIGDIGLYRISGTSPAPTAGSANPPARITIVSAPPVSHGQRARITASVDQPASADYVAFVRDNNANGVVDPSDTLLQNVEVVSGQAITSVDTDSLGPGSYSYVSRVRLLNSTWGNSVAQTLVVSAPIGRAPTITSLNRTPNPVLQGETLSLQARIDDPDSIANFVQFVWDRDGSDSVTTGDTILGNGSPISRGTSTFTLPVTEDYAIGLQHFLVRVRYRHNTAWTDSMVGVVDVSPPPGSKPHVVSLTSSDTILVRGLTLTLTANGVGGPKPITEVRFYRDSNGNGTLQSNGGLGDDEYLGSDTSSAGGWKKLMSTSSFPMGANLFFVQPEDGIQKGNFVSTIVTLTPADTMTPTAALTSAPDVNVPGAPSYGFSVTYTDDVAINSFYFTEALNQDIKLFGLGGNYNPTATFVSVSEPGDGTPRIVNYRVTPPGGSWDVADNGVYSLSLGFSKVGDTSAHYIPNGQLGSFTVNIPDGTSPVVALNGLSANSDLPTLTRVSTFDVSGTASDTESGVVSNRYHFFLSAFHDGEWSDAIDFGASGSTTTFQALPDGLYAPALQAENSAGFTASSPSSFFIVDTNAPTGSLGTISPDTILTTDAGYVDIRWTDPGTSSAGVDPAMIDVNDVSIVNDGRTLTINSVTDQGGGVWRYRYAEPLHTAANGSALPVQVTFVAGQVKDLAGNANVVDTESFLFDNKAPRVLSSVMNPDQVNPTPPGPTTWAQQRSRMASYVVNFSEPVQSIALANVQLLNLGVNAPATADVTVTLLASQLSLNTAGTQLTLTFPASGTGSLADGVYLLRVLPTVTDGANALDGDGNGTGGDAYIVNGSAINKFFVLRADWNGSGGVNLLDYGTFATYNLKVVGPTGAPAYVDLNNSGGVNLLDYGIFSSNYLKFVTFDASAGSGAFGSSAFGSSGSGSSTSGSGGSGSGATGSGASQLYFPVTVGTQGLFPGSTRQDSQPALLQLYVVSASESKVAAATSQQTIKTTKPQQTSNSSAISSFSSPPVSSPMPKDPTPPSLNLLNELAVNDDIEFPAAMGWMYAVIQIPTDSQSEASLLESQQGDQSIDDEQSFRNAFDQEFDAEEADVVFADSRELFDSLQSAAEVRWIPWLTGGYSANQDLRRPQWSFHL